MSLFKHLKINQCKLEDGSSTYSVLGISVVTGANYVWM